MATTNLDKSNVSTGKPKAGGAVFVAPAGTPLPTDATTELSEAFVCVGFVDPDGVTVTPTETANDVTEWGGSTVDQDKSEFKETTAFAMLESKAENMCLLYGDDAVTKTETGYRAVHRGGNDAERVMVIDTLIKNARVRRIGIPRAVFESMEAVKYSRTELVKYAATFTNLYDETIDGCSVEYVSDKVVSE